MSCPPGQVLDGMMCYPPCPEGYIPDKDRCVQTCPPGFSDLGMSCLKPVIPRGDGIPVRVNQVNISLPPQVKSFPWWGWLIVGLVVLLLVGALIFWIVSLGRPKVNTVGYSNTLDQHLRQYPQRQILV